MQSPSNSLSSEQIQQQWDDLSAEEVSRVNGDIGSLMDVLTEKYGISRDEAARQVDQFIREGSRASETSFSATDPHQ